MWDVRQPTVSIRRAEKPGVPASTTNSEMPWCPPSGPVTAAATTKSAMGPFVMKVFVPDRIHPVPLRSARVRMAATSDPAPGSVTASAPIDVPATAGTSHRRRWSSVPNRYT